MTAGMGRALTAGLVYFAVVFSAGFVLGAIRTIWLSPAMGQLGAVAIELPFMLAASWLACGWCLHTFSISDQLRQALMGAVAFVVLMAAEAGLAIAAFGMRPEEYVAGLLTAAGLLGLSGQVAFAVMPLVYRIAPEGPGFG